MTDLVLLRAEQYQEFLVLEKSRLRAQTGIRNEETLKQLIRGMEDALHYQKQVGAIYAREIPLKEFKTTFVQVQTALRKLAEGRGDPDKAWMRLTETTPNIPPKMREYFDVVYSEIWGDEVFDDYAYDPNRSVLERLIADMPAMSEQEREDTIKRLLEATDAFIEEINSPGKGNARRAARQYIMGITLLARHFNEALPDSNISSAVGSAFHNYVACWLRGFVKADVQDPRRHIQYTIDSGRKLTF